MSNDETTTQLENLQFKDFIITHNKITEECFSSCINDFTAVFVPDGELKCISNCFDKMIKVRNRIGTRL